MSQRSRIMVYCAWSMAITFCTPQIIVFSYREVTSGIWDCWATFDLIPHGERIYVTWYSVSVFLLPLCVLIYTYARICMDIGKYSRTTGRTDVDVGRVTKNCDFFHWSRSPLISRARMNAVKQSIVIVSLYVASSSPFIGSLLWATWDPEATSSPFFYGATFTILALLNSLNSCVNPWIYLAFNKNFRQALLDRFHDFA